MRIGLSMYQHSNWNQYADFCRKGAYAACPQEHRDATGQLSFHMLKIERSDHDNTDPPVPETIIAVPLAATEGNAWDRDLGAGWRRESAVPGRVLLLPESTESRWQVRGRGTLLVLAVPTATLQRVLGPVARGNAESTLRPLGDETWEDALAPALLAQMWSSLRSPHAVDRLFIDSALVTLVSHFAQRTTSRSAERGHIALPSWRLKRVRDYVQEHLHEQIEILDLAELAGLSVRHFTRVFREEVGQTPHQWLRALRIERAIQLLSSRKHRLVDVAELSGFSDQSHFTNVFKEITGYTPLRWLNANRVD
jgi:AraC family transcriptional regulator